MGASQPSAALIDKPSDPPLREGSILGGKYRIEEVLGRGGMGVVVAATHLLLDQRVALKFLLRSAAEKRDIVTRFTREARAAAKIQSEHAARVLDIETLPSGEPFMVLELLEGSDLGELLRANGPLPVQEAVTHVLQACEAIAEAHALGIVHRDLKPENLFLANRIDGSQIIKVLDFGISKLCSSEPVSATAGITLTRTQAVIGSPLYMSPEQLRDARAADPRSDIWSLGVTLYELIAGTGPFPWNSLPELCAAVLKEPPIPLRQRRPAVSEGLDAAVLRCLEKNPRTRYPNVAELAAALLPFGLPNTSTSSERAARVLFRTVPPSTVRLPGRSPLATTAGSESIPPTVPRTLPAHPGDADLPLDSPRAHSHSIPPESQRTPKPPGAHSPSAPPECPRCSMIPERMSAAPESHGPSLPPSYRLAGCTSSPSVVPEPPAVTAYNAALLRFGAVRKRHVAMAATALALGAAVGGYLVGVPEAQGTKTSIPSRATPAPAPAHSFAAGRAPASSPEPPESPAAAATTAPAPPSPSSTVSRETPQALKRFTSPPRPKARPAKSPRRVPKGLFSDRE